MPYECGIDPVDSARGRYTVRFYIIAILFVIFDVETIFLFPWAIRYKALGWFVAAEMVVFLGILIVCSSWADNNGARESFNQGRISDLGCRSQVYSMPRE